ncbi:MULTISPECIES: ATP-binding protein [unclassified Frankia]|uniref:ATP-binding protein n=1 Tax=unclassified Frankia TaxID=2632575 RepID=UPI002AD374E7|nr:MULTISPECIES: SbcC/MukB-like Walker B domain-containing protein [unclassified Frankia]
MSQPALLPDPTETGETQWIAESMQLVNWGGFHGCTLIEFDAEATLVSGASGTGKSTVLDAYLALMMPSDTPFNGASNDAAAGRARNPEQRNLLTYLRGKTDDSREAGTGALTDKVLRGVDGPTWGAIALTFADGGGRRLTVLRAYHVSRGAVASKDVMMKMATLEGRLDLRELEPLAAAKFDKGTLKTRWPSMFVATSYTEFAQRLFDRLGIGAGGDGAKALRLLARIQAGQQVRTVDGLYKAMVLEQPATYGAADNAAKHFDDLDASYQEMQTAAAKQHTLARLPQLWDERGQAHADERLIDTFGATRTGDTPFLLWQLRTRDRLLDVATRTALESRPLLTERTRAARKEQTRLKGEIAGVEEARRAAGGDTIERLKAEIEAAQGARDTARDRRNRFAANTIDLGIDPATAADFAAAQTAARTFLGELPATLEELADEQAGLRKKGWPAQARRADLDADRNSLTGRTGRVPRRLHEARLAIAAAADIDPAQLPFVAELIDVAPGEQEWRKAAEVTLYSIARILLVDDRRLRQLSRAIDPIRLPIRVQFEGVALRAHAEEPGNPRYVSGKLLYKESPFSWWIRERVTRRSTDHLCVETPADLDGDGARVTRNGQTRNGRRGAHGDLTDASVIGFSSADRLAEINTEIAALDVSLGDLLRREAAFGQEALRLHQLEGAHKWVQATEWADIDADGSQAYLAGKQGELARLLAAHDVLAALDEQHSGLEQLMSEVQAEFVRANDRLVVVEAEYAKLCEQQDETTLAIDRIDADGTVTLTDSQRDYLDTVFTDVGSLDSLADFDRSLPKIRSRLIERTSRAREKVSEATNTLIGTFEQFQSRWPDPNRGVGIDSYPEYRDILDKIVAVGLAERRHEWRRRLSEWSGQDLVPLSGAFGAAFDEIRARLDPINDILAALPFGPANDRLRISLRVLQSDDVARFRRQLAHLASGVTDDVSDEQAEQRFLQLRSFIALLRKPDDSARPAGVNRDVYLDVRRHVEITAVRVDVHGRELATYASLGGKSGGETQELMAFVVGAALRYQLGDEDRRPRFAPVFLDEGFIKSDSEFAGRSVQAWKKLGFQLIVSAPLDKVTALEPAMPLILTVTKSPKGYSHVTRLRGIDDETPVSVTNPDGPRT